jgi:hypothetical protein
VIEVAEAIKRAELAEKHKKELEEIAVSLERSLNRVVSESFKVIKDDDFRNEINNIIDSDEFRIEKALLCTTKLMLLNKRDTKKAEKKHVQHLRNEIIGSFPERATLSQSGINTFKDILPDEDDNTYAFYNRILAGFSKMISNDNYEDMRIGLEYISRKKLLLPIPQSFIKWPLSSELTANDINLIVNDGDPCWFLWAMLFCVYPGNKNVATNFKLFCKNWRKNSRLERIGLLWGIPFIIDDYSDLVWTVNDLEVFDKVKNITSELWTYTLNEHKESQEVKANEKKIVETGDNKHKEFYNNTPQDENKNKMALFGSFIPRKVATSTYDNENDNYDHLVESINTGATTKMVRVQNKLIPSDQKKPNMSINKIDNIIY